MQNSQKSLENDKSILINENLSVTISGTTISQNSNPHGFGQERRAHGYAVIDLNNHYKNNKQLLKWIADIVENGLVCLLKP